MPKFTAYMKNKNKMPKIKRNTQILCFLGEENIHLIGKIKFQKYSSPLKRRKQIPNKKNKLLKINSRYFNCPQLFSLTIIIVIPVSLSFYFL